MMFPSILQQNLKRTKFKIIEKLNLQYSFALK